MDTHLLSGDCMIWAAVPQVQLGLAAVVREGGVWQRIIVCDLTPILGDQSLDHCAVWGGVLPWSRGERGRDADEARVTHRPCTRHSGMGCST